MANIASLPRAAWGAVAALLLVAMPPAADAATRARPAAAAAEPAGCAATGGLKFVCGVPSSEDAVPIPGTRWLLAAGRKAGLGIKLIDTDAKTARPAFTGAPAEMRPDKALYPICPEVLDVKAWVSHGIYLRSRSAREHTLYVVEDGPLQSVQVFDVDTSGAEPALTWKGCVPMPEGDKAYANLGAAATSERLGPNSVAAFSDGTILVSVPRRPGTTPTQRFNGAPTGDVLEWHPGWSGFRVMQGVQVPYANGLEISKDESEFYVAAYSAQKIYVFNRQDYLMPVRFMQTPGIMPDNIHWSGDRLIVAGMMYDEPVCGGTQLAMNGSPAQWSCHRGFVVAQVYPNGGDWKILAYFAPHPGLNVVATGLIVGDTLWIGGSTSDGLAYLPLPRLPDAAR